MVKRVLKRILPGKVIEAYRAVRIGVSLLGELGALTPRAIREWVGLCETIRKVRVDSFLNIHGFCQLHRLAREIDRAGIVGDFVECGVFRGGSAAVLGYALRHSSITRHLWLFDSFQGLPEPSALDGPNARPLAGDIVGDEQNVRRLQREAGAPLDRVHIIAGWFQETFPNTPVGRVALLHIDADWYESIKLCLQHFYDMLEPGAVVVLDDYYDWPGCKAAFEEFVRRRSLSIEMKQTREAPPYFYKPL